MTIRLCHCPRKKHDTETQRYTDTDRQAHTSMHLNYLRMGEMIEPSLLRRLYSVIRLSINSSTLGVRVTRLGEPHLPCPSPLPTPITTVALSTLASRSSSPSSPLLQVVVCGGSTKACVVGGSEDRTTNRGARPGSKIALEPSNSTRR